MTMRIEFIGETREDILFQIADMFRLPPEMLSAALSGSPVLDTAVVKETAAKPESKKAAAINGTGDTLVADEPVAKAKGGSLFDEGEDEAAEKEAPKKEKKITLAELKKVLVEHVNKHSEPKTMALMKKVSKADKISKLDPKHYNAVYEAVTAEL